MSNILKRSFGSQWPRSVKKISKLNFLSSFWKIYCFIELKIFIYEILNRILKFVFIDVQFSPAYEMEHISNRRDAIICFAYAGACQTKYWYAYQEIMAMGRYKCYMGKKLLSSFYSFAGNITNINMTFFVEIIFLLK